MRFLESFRGTIPRNHRSEAAPGTRRGKQKLLRLKGFSFSTPGGNRTHTLPLRRQTETTLENAPNDYVFQCLERTRSRCIVQDSLRGTTWICGVSTAFCGIPWNPLTHHPRAARNDIHLLVGDEHVVADTAIPPRDRATRSSLRGTARPGSEWRACRTRRPARVRLQRHRRFSRGPPREFSSSGRAG